MNVIYSGSCSLLVVEGQYIQKLDNLTSNGEDVVHDILVSSSGGRFSIFNTENRSVSFSCLNGIVLESGSISFFQSEYEYVYSSKKMRVTDFDGAENTLLVSSDLKSFRNSTQTVIPAGSFVKLDPSRSITF